MVTIRNVQIQSVEGNLFFFVSNMAVHKLTTTVEGLELFIFRRTSPQKFVLLVWLRNR